jgi:WG containing repeat
MATVILDRRVGYVNRIGELVVPPSFLRGERFSDGLAAVNIGSGKAHQSIAEACEVGFIDATGAFAITPRFFATGSFQDGLCLAETEKDLLYVDRKGSPVWRDGWVELGSFDPLHLLPSQA